MGPSVAADLLLLFASLLHPPASFFCPYIPPILVLYASTPGTVSYPVWWPSALSQLSSLELCARRGRQNTSTSRSARISLPVLSDIDAHLEDALVEEGVDPATFARQLEVEAIRPEESASQAASHANKGSKAASLSGPVVLKRLEEAATRRALGEGKASQGKAGYREEANRVTETERIVAA